MMSTTTTTAPAITTLRASNTTAPVNGTPHESITAANVQRLFPDVSPSSFPPTHNGGGTGSAASGDLDGYDPEQIKLMDEVCIVLSTDDEPIGSASKKTCHLMSNIERGLLHRAFSVFLFDPETKKLLLQQRASEKITFPDMWTNTCCSHPLGIPGETGAGLVEAVAGVKRAAQRKLDQELGIQAKQVPTGDMKFLGRIHYLAPSDGKWGEHEIDYIIFTQAKVHLDINPNEVQDAKYVSQQELQDMFQDTKLKFTPWFKLICETMLFDWWNHLESGLEKFEGDTEIRRM